MSKQYPSKRTASLTALVLLAVAAPVSAGDIEATSTTLVQGRGDPRDGQVHTLVPVIEAVSVRATHLSSRALDDMAVILSAWGEADLNQPISSRLGVSGDLDLAYVEGSRWHRAFQLRVGRQLATGGAARMAHFDGLNLVGQWRGLGLQAYGGIPAVPRFGVHVGDAVFGGRAFYRRSVDAEIGASFIEILDGSTLARQDAALDARWVPHATLNLGGVGIWSIPERRLAEAQLSASWIPGSRVQLTAEARRLAPDLFLPRTSIFTVFSQDHRDELGGWFQVQPARSVKVLGDYHLTLLSDGHGQQAGVKAIWRASDGGTLTVSPEARIYHYPQNGFRQIRLSVVDTPTPRLALVLDADTYFLEQRVNGADRSVTLTATATYRVRPSWLLALSGLVGSTPLFERRAEVMARLVYQFSTRQEVRQ